MKFKNVIVLHLKINVIFISLLFKQKIITPFLIEPFSNLKEHARFIFSTKQFILNF